MYGHKNMAPKMHGEFMIWYNRVKHETFDF
jgi:hypothetical protein